MNKNKVNMDPHKNFCFSAKAEKKIEGIMEKYPPDRRASAVMPLLDLAQIGKSAKPLATLEKEPELPKMETTKRRRRMPATPQLKGG